MSDRPFDIITIGDLCVDLAVDLGAVMPVFGQVEQWIPNYVLDMGGSAGIFACQAAKLGLRVAILGRVGDDELGSFLLKKFQQCGVDTRFIQIDAGLKTGCGIALCRSSGDRAILTYGGSLNAVYPADVTDDFLKSGRHFHHCSYYLQTNLLGHVPGILQRAKALGTTISLDTNWDPQERWDGQVRAALAYADLFFPNANEAMLISGCKELESAIEWLVKRVPVVAVKMGGSGALVTSRQERVLATVEPVTNLADTIGAGDNFDAGFLAGWLGGESLRACAEFGNLCGRTSTVARGGVAGQLDLREKIPRNTNDQIQVRGDLGTTAEER